MATALDWSRTAKETEKRDEGRALKNGATGDQAPERQDLFSLFDVAAASGILFADAQLLMLILMLVRKKNTSYEMYGLFGWLVRIVAGS